MKGPAHVNYDAVIFDLYGTLIDYIRSEDYLEVNRRMCAVLGVPPDEFRRLWSSTQRERDRGEFGSVEDAMAGVCAKLGFAPTAEQVKEATLIRFEDAIRRNTTPREGAVETLTSLKSAGCKTGLITDCGYEISDLWHITPFAPFIDAAVFSATAKMVKPAPRIYGIACEKLEVTPERCLYVGDGGSNELTGAMNVGMHPVLIATQPAHGSEIYRPDQLNWNGPVITDLRQVLRML